MLRIVYGTKGQAVPDHYVYEWVDYNIERFKNISYTYTINTSNELVLMTFALRTIEGIIPENEIEFYYEDEKLDFDMCLGIQNPKGTRLGIFSEVVEKSLNAGYKNMKNRKKT